MFKMGNILVYKGEPFFSQGHTISYGTLFRVIGCDNGYLLEGLDLDSVTLYVNTAGLLISKFEISDEQLQEIDIKNLLLKFNNDLSIKVDHGVALDFVKSLDYIHNLIRKYNEGDLVVVSKKDNTYFSLNNIINIEHMIKAKSSVEQQLGSFIYNALKDKLT